VGQPGGHVSFVNQNVVGSYVAVDDSTLMGKNQGFPDLQDQAQVSRGVGLTVGDCVIECPTCDVFHHEVMVAAIFVIRLKDAHDMRVRELLHCSSPPSKSFPALLVVAILTVENLNGDNLLGL